MLLTGKRVGIVTTARITHATPGAAYANTPDRNWESDDRVPEVDREECRDIAYQLVKENPNINVSSSKFLLP